MTDTIRNHEGTIVKTIGDAVMAAFPVNLNAVRAACAIQEAFRSSIGTMQEVMVKIGLHRGPTIVVTSNRRLDYFGRTVNIAARAQGTSGAGEIVVTAPVLDNEAKLFLREIQLEPIPEKVVLKGISEKFEVFRVSP